VRAVLALLICALAPIAAQAQPKQPTDVELKALGETAGEMEVCSAFFMVVAACLAPQEPKLAGDYEKKGKQIGGLSFTLLKNVGMSEEAISAQYDNYTKLYDECDAEELHKHCRPAETLFELLPAPKSGRRPPAEGMGGVLPNRACRQPCWRTRPLVRVTRRARTLARARAAALDPEARSLASAITAALDSLAAASATALNPDPGS
jgi:hypothetical protein